MKNINKLGNYLALTLGAGAAATSAEGATAVTFFGQGVTPPAGINPADTGGFWMALDYLGKENSSFFAAGDNSNFFTRGTDLSSSGSSDRAYFAPSSPDYAYGAEVGDSNYANISLNGNDQVYEAVGQFHIGSGDVWLIALAKNDDNSALSISAGKTAIDAAGTSPVPEVSSHLALLALGSAGVLTRRRLKRAA